MLKYYYCNATFSAYAKKTPPSTIGRRQAARVGTLSDADEKEERERERGRERYLAAGYML